jgi:uncharacterized protein YjbJ (UPF0337 family)
LNVPNFPSLIRGFINDDTNWTETDPAFDEVKFPQAISQAFLVRASTIGRCMLWIEESGGAVTDPQTQGMGLCRGVFDVFCYARAKSSAEADTEDAKDKAENMRDQVSDIVKANWNQLTGAFFMRPYGTYALKEKIDPIYFVKVLTVEVYYEI